MDSALEKAGKLAFPDFAMDVVESCSSTQDLAAALLGLGAPEGHVVVAMEQTNGRGRQGRQWLAKPGSSLLCSLVLRPESELRPLVTILAGVVVAEAIGQVVGSDPQLKWPNDVLVGGLKAAGVLAEAKSDGIILGVGVNLTVDEFPPEVRGISLHQLAGRGISWEEMLAEILRSWGAWELKISKSGVTCLLEQWRVMAVGLAEPVSVDFNGDVITGIAADIQNDGALLVKTENGMRALYAGEVHLLAGDRQGD